MQFNINKSIQVLSNTPEVMRQLLSHLNDEWIFTNEGEGTWSPYDIAGHLIQGEKTDWIPRLEIFISDNIDKKFPVFDRFAQFEESKGKSLDELLNEFSELRERNLKKLFAIDFTEELLNKTAIHPEFGEVTLRQHLATWVAHDLGHIAQICRVMAKQYKDEAGPWIKYLKVLQS